MKRRRGEGRKSSFCAKAVAVPLPPLFCLQQFSLGEADAREKTGEERGRGQRSQTEGESGGKRKDFCFAFLAVEHSPARFPLLLGHTMYHLVHMSTGMTQSKRMRQKVKENQGNRVCTFVLMTLQ